MTIFNNTIPLLFLVMFGSFFYYIMIEDKDKDDTQDKDKKDKEDKEEVKVVEKQIIKYEDKYWEKFEKMLNKEENKEENKEKNKEKNEVSKNNILFEITPNGNVLMIYDSNRSSFIYYADTAIPYRYLETVARKYVTTYFCLHLYVDMQKEIAEAEKKLTDKKLEEKQKLEEEQKLEEKQKLEEEREKYENKDQNRREKKKNVFAKLKNYNTGSNTVVKGNKIAETNPNRAATGSNAIINSKKEYVLKENANRFSYEGKIVNYNLLKKPERKTSAFSFADFKKMQLENKNNK